MWKAGGGYSTVTTHGDVWSYSEGIQVTVSGGGDAEVTTYGDVYSIYGEGIQVWTYSGDSGSGGGNIDIWAAGDVTTLHNEAIYAFAEGHVDHSGNITIHTDGYVTNFDGNYSGGGDSAILAVNERTIDAFVEGSALIDININHGVVWSQYGSGIEVFSYGNNTIDVASGASVRGFGKAVSGGADTEWVIDLTTNIDVEGSGDPTSTTITNHGFIGSRFGGPTSYGDGAIIERGAGAIAVYNYGTLHGRVDFSASAASSYVLNTSNTSLAHDGL